MHSEALIIISCWGKLDKVLDCLLLVFISYWYCNKLAQISDLNQYKFIISKFWGLEVCNGSYWTKIRYWWGCVSFGGSRGKCFPFLFQRLLVFLGSRPLPHITSSSSFIVTALSPYLLLSSHLLPYLWFSGHPLSLIRSLMIMGPSK